MRYVVLQVVLRFSKCLKPAMCFLLSVCFLLSICFPLSPSDSNIAYAEENYASETSPSLFVSVDPPEVRVYGVSLDAPSPIIRDGVVWVPFRAIAEAYNYRMEWVANSAANVEWDDKTVLFIDYQGHVSYVTVDGENAIIIDGRTFVPYNYLLTLNLEDNDIIKRLGFTKEYILYGILENRAIFGKHFTEPSEEWNLRKLGRGLAYPYDFRYRDCYTKTDPIKSISVAFYNYENPYPDGGLNPFYDMIDENNALTLFAVIEDLEQVNFLYYIDDELDHTDSFTLDDLSERFGAITPFEMDADELYDAFAGNLQTSEWYFAHYSRIYLGTDSADVSYRNGEPDEIKTRSDGSIVIWEYAALNKSFTTLPTGEEVINNPGYEASYYFSNEPSELLATKFSVSDGESYLDLIANLGFPSVIRDMDGDNKYVAYLLRDDSREGGQHSSERQKFAYYILQNNRIVAEGVMYGDDYSLVM